MTHPLATPRLSDVDRICEALVAGHSIVRASVRQEYGISDRAFRAAVRVLREAGMPVVAESAEGSVYRLARTQAELDAFVAEMESRARVLEAQIRALRAGALRYFPQAAEQMALGVVG